MLTSNPIGGIRRRGLTLAVLAAGLLVAALVACSDGDDPIAVPEPTTTTTRSSAPATSGVSTPSSTTTSTAPPAPEVEIVDRYQEFWEARFRANQPPPNPDDPALAEHATGLQLENVVDETRQNLDEGLALRRPEGGVRRSRVNVISVDGDEADLQECFVDDGVVYRPATGEVVNDAVATHNVRATMQRIGGVWKLATTQLIQRWEGVAGCALAENF